ncbi:MAG: branched-chain amino acid ABC transporter permease [Desulfobacteraceae bacterium]|nr:branched-chain amino acid ABC transporter permease [Desulfobacteraceae bacterium]
MFTKPIHTKLLYIVIFVAALLLPWYVPDAYIFQVVITSVIFGIAASGMNLILGYTGQATLAHGAFFGIGAYGVAIMTEAGISFWLALPAAALISAAVGLVVGVLTLRTKGAYFAIVTLCFGVIAWIVAGNWIELTGGHNGIYGLGDPTPIPFPFFGPIEFTTQTSMYFLSLAALLVVLFALYRLVYSVFGLSLMAVRNNEPLADAVGINTFATKVISFVAGNFIAGIAGGIYAIMMASVSPSATSYLLTFNFLIFVILGGMATLPGPVFGAFAIPVLMEFLQFLQDYRHLIFGALLIAVIIYFPQGFVGGLRRLNQKIAARRKQKTSES